MENITTWVISNDQNYLKMTYMPYLTDFHLSNVYLLADGKLFSVGKYLVDVKHLASIQMSTDLTYLTIDEKLDCVWSISITIQI